MSETHTIHRMKGGDTMDEADGLIALAEWTAGYINRLPDSAFLFISPGGEKDDDGKTKPRILRHFPFRDSKGAVDLPHLRNAIGRIPQSTAGGLTAAKMRALQDKARKMLRADEGKDLAEQDVDDKGETPDDAIEGANYSDHPGFWGAPRRVEVLADTAQTWVEVVRSGTFYGSAGPSPRRVTLSPQDVHSMAQSFDTVLDEGWFNGGPCVGYNHASAFGSRDPSSTKAAARIQRVETRQNHDGSLSLWGLFSWTDEGARRVQAGEFSSVSAELIPADVSTSKLTGAPLGAYVLVGATLTNSPMIPGMQPPTASRPAASMGDGHPHRIALTDGDPPPSKEIPPMTDILLRLAEATGLPSDQAGLLSEIQRLQADAAKVDTLSDALETATREAEGLRERNVTLESRETKRTLDAACAIGRIAPTERDDYLKIVDAVGEDRAHRIFTEGRIPVGRDSSEQAPADTGSTGDEAFLALVDQAVSDGRTEQEAWDIARVALGSTVYPDLTVEN